jgi:single-strand DNA-binding protein
MLQITALGNIGKDAKITEHNGRKAIQFHIAINESYKDANGVTVEKATWLSCSFWRGPGQSIAIAEYLKAGTKVLVQGKPSVHTYTSKDGEHMASLDVNVYNVEFAGPAKKADEAAQTQPQQQQQGNQTNNAPADIIPNVNFDSNPVSFGTQDDDLPF